VRFIPVDVQGVFILKVDGSARRCPMVCGDGRAGGQS
jgi:hypothetical protein